jgi:hypothetical protein
MLATNQLVSRKAAEAVTKALPREADSDDEGRARVQLLWAAASDWGDGPLPG